MPAKKKEEKKNDTTSLQPEINIGFVGHVDHGKTTLTEQLSGKWTDTHSEEIKRGITIRLGYADAVIRKCPKCKGHKAYTVKQKCPVCDTQTITERKVSFVDAPGHESLMATMLSGASLMDGAILMVAANETCPQPQTREHLTALEISGIKNIIIVQNKIDLVPKERILRNLDQIKEFVKGTVAENAPIVPISAQHGVNIDYLLETIQTHIPTPPRDDKQEARMYVARSFDINKPGSKIANLQGGVLGGAVIQGVFKEKDEIEIRPGKKVEAHGRVTYQPITTTVLSLMTGGAKVKEVRPGGSMAMMTLLDPSVVKSDSLSGSVVGHVGKLPPVHSKIKLETHLLSRVVGTVETVDVDPIKKMEPLMLNVNSAATVGVVTEIKKNEIQCQLKLPICAEYDSKITISRRVGNRFHLIGYGILKE